MSKRPKQWEISRVNMWRVSFILLISLRSVRNSGIKESYGNKTFHDHFNTDTVWFRPSGAVTPLTGTSQSHWSPDWYWWTWWCCCGPLDKSGRSRCSALGSPGTAGKNAVHAPPLVVKNLPLPPLQSQRKWQAGSWSEHHGSGGGGFGLWPHLWEQAAAAGTPLW